MTNKLRKNGKKRIILRWWQKALLILGCTALCVLAAWLLCEKTLTPVYVDTVRAKLEITADAMTEMKSQSSAYTEDVLNIRGSLSDQLGKVGSREEKGRYYKLLTAVLAEAGFETKPRDLENLISTSTVEDGDETHQIIRIQLNNKGSGALDDDAFRTLVQAAGEQFGILIFGEPASADQMTVSLFRRDEQDIWTEADPETVQGSVWAAEVTVSKAAVDALPNRGDFYNKHLDLRELLSGNMTDEDYRQIASAAGVSARPDELRKSITFPLTSEENIVLVNVAWENGQEEAGKIAVAAANQAATVIFRTILGTEEPAENQFRYNMDELNGTWEPYRYEVVSNAGAYIQSFYSERPQFKTDMAMTAQAKELWLVKTADSGLSSDLFAKLGASWSKKEFLPEESRDAFVGLAGGETLYTFSPDEVQALFRMEESADDPSGRTVLIYTDPAELIASACRQTENKAAAGENSLRGKRADGEIDEDTLEKALELLGSQKGTVLNAVNGIADDIEAAVIGQVDILFFGYTEDKEPFRTVRSEAGVITYTITDEGLDNLKDDCYAEPARDVRPGAAAAGLDSGNGYQQILQEAGTGGPGDALKNSVVWTETDDGLDVNISWSDKTTTRDVGRAAMTVLSRRLTQETDGRALRLVIDSSQTRILREQARMSPPATLPTMVIVGLIALTLSYILFSQQSLFDSLIIIFFVIFTFICIFPFYYLFINTISDNTKVAAGRINFLPEGIHLKNYQRIFSRQELGDSAIVTVARTVIGTALMVLTSAWAGYLVTKRKMWRRSFWYRALVITMYFNAGLIPWYTNMLMLGLTNNFLAYIIPGMVAPYNIILVKTYIESIPGSLEESAIIDGASTGKVFLRIILPLSIPILATIAIFGAVGNWNSFQDSYLLMTQPKLYTLQHQLYIYLKNTTSIDTEQISEQMAQNLMNNGITTKYTIAMVTIIPILLVYPVMQRYFVKGIMLGAVKG